MPDDNTSHISDKGLALVKRFESYSPVAYICPAGYPTIGYGHVVREGEHYTTLDVHQANELLRKDMAIAESAVSRLICVPLTSGQFDALVSFTFNLGSGALQRSTLRRKINREEFEEVPEEFMKWVRAGGRILNGLIARRRAEVDLWLNS